MARRPNSEIVLKALRQGAEVTLGTCVYRLQDYEMLVRVKRTRLGGKEPPEPEDIWVHADLRLSVFLKLCDKLTEDEAFLIAGENGLRDMKKARG